MNHRFVAAMSVALFWTAVLASAQQLTVSGSTPKLDGAVSINEYPLTVPVGNITLSAARTADSLFLAVRAPTTGWVAVGFGSDRMDGAKLFLGYVSGGKTNFTQQLGAGHGHSRLPSEMAVRDALGEAGGVTTMETAFKSNEVIPEGQKELWVLVAYGADDSFSGYHVARGKILIQL